MHVCLCTFDVHGVHSLFKNFMIGHSSRDVEETLQYRSLEFKEHIRAGGRIWKLSSYSCYLKN